MMGESKGLTGDLRIKTIDIKKQKKPMKKFMTLGIVILLLIVSMTILNIQVPKENENKELSDELVRRVDAKVGIVCVQKVNDGTAGGGAYPMDATAAARMFEYAGCTVYMIDSDDVQNDRLTTENFDIIYFGGGNAYTYKLYYDPFDQAFPNNVIAQKIQNFVNNGGAYMGHCAGGYYATDDIEWEGSTYDYHLDLLNPGRATGSITDISDFPAAWQFATIRAVDPDFPAWNGNSYTTQYYWGPYFENYDTNVVDVVAVYDYAGYADELPAMIKFPYGAGRVFLAGPHPEFEESASLDGDRDWSFSDDWYDDGTAMVDPETEYDMMADIIAWLAPTKVVYEKKSDIDRAAPPATPYRAAVYAGLGTSARVVWPTMKMLEYFGITPYAWDEYGNDKITIDRFDLVVFPNGDAGSMAGPVDDVTIDAFVANGGDVIGIGGGQKFVIATLHYWEDWSWDLTPPAQHGLENITIINSGSYNGDFCRFKW